MEDEREGEIEEEGVRKWRGWGRKGGGMDGWI
jgi:hypothetical protein